MIWLVLSAQAADPWCRLEDQALSEQVAPWLVGTRTPAFTVSHDGVRADGELGPEGLLLTLRYRGQSLRGQVDPADDQHLYLSGEGALPLGQVGDLLPGAQVWVVTGTRGEVVAQPPPWVSRALVSGTARATVPCDRLTVTRDPDAAEASTTRALAKHTERVAEAGADLLLHDAPDGRAVGTVRIQDLARAVYVGETRGSWSRVAVPSWPRGVLWRGWVRELQTRAPGGVGLGGGGSGEALPPSPTRYATARCEQDVSLWAVGPERVEVGTHAAGGELVLLEDHGDRAKVLLHDSWARPAAAWHFEATNLTGCTRGEITLP